MELGTSSEFNKKYEFSASTGWMTSFPKRHAYHNIKIKSETPSEDKSAVKEFLQKLAEIIKLRCYTNDQVWNADESGIPNRTYVLTKYLNVIFIFEGQVVLEDRA
ncbi:hypothetical protein CDAR_168691 [Caerostris darwini]|uniref:HTH CENPB-type domain-containing protein n=1 Tax=Caerostris darwini TaxID=1538125 RepID=A0AAV4T4I4_9ARAC|nr:hypothetical protein CDAR_168691 [Caerostris darwini]